MLGLYIHVPFCISKCPYCDFYSLPLPSEDVIDAYVDTVIRSLKQAPPHPTDTLYFGGGTPSLLGGERVARIITAARNHCLTSDAEITLEANPAEKLYDTFAAFAAVGGNRLSLGMQSLNSHTLKALGRRHSPADLETALHDAEKAGIGNVSLDMMLATPFQTERDIVDAAKACAAYNASHVSAYLLKIEPHTPFFDQASSLALPDDDCTADMYLTACEALEAAGFAQYEISNFAKDGKKSRHNLKYWNSEDYLGIGPAAHSFIDGKRWFYERSLEAFLNGATPIAEDSDSDIANSSEEEYAMLRLRLTDGICADLFEKRFAHSLPEKWIIAAKKFPTDLVTVTQDGIRLTRQGFLLSNTLISRILWEDM